jgi:chaperonin GroES
MKVKPIGERVLVRREEAEKTTAGGIILQAESIERPAQGEVIAVGDVESVKVGDTIIFGKYAGGDSIDIDGETIAIIELKDIKAVIYD